MTQRAENGRAWAQVGTLGWLTKLAAIHFFVIVSILPRASAGASAGSLDASFNVGSGDSGFNAILPQPDGKVVIAGIFTYYHSTFCQGIARLNSDASFDSSFVTTNSWTSGNGINAGYLYPDGKILIVGGFQTAGRNRIARLNSDGTLDPSFNPGAGPNFDVRCLAVQPDGKILLGGNFTTIGGQAANYIGRLNPDGTVDTNFTAAADNAVDAIALQPDGKIVVGGWFAHINGAAIANLARLNTTGTTDTGFLPSVTVPVETVAIQTDARIIFGGNFNFSSGSPIARAMPNGAWDVAFIPTVNSWVRTVRVQDDGRILVGGAFTTVNGTNRAYLARLYFDGSTDLTFNAGIDNIVNGIAFPPDGKILIAGGFGSVDGVPEYGLARLFGDDPAAQPVVEINGGTFQALQSDASVVLPVLRTGNTNLSVSVQFGTRDLDAQAGSDYVGTNGTLTFGPGEVAKLVTIPLLNDGQAENFEQLAVFLTNAVSSTLGFLTNATITVFGVDNPVQIVTPDITTNELAGSVSVSIVRAGTNLASSVWCQTLDGTAISGSQFINLSQTISFAPGQATNTISLRLLDDVLFGQDRFFNVVLSNATNLQIGTRSNLTVTILDNDAPGHPGYGVNGAVNALAPYTNGDLVLGGSFISVNGIGRSRVARVHADETLDPAFGTGTGADSAVNAVLVQPDGKIICGGSFASYDGTARLRLARLNFDGSLDSSFAPGAGPDNIVTALTPAANGGAFVGGFFTQYAGVARVGIAKINSTGGLDSSFIPSIPNGASPFRVLCIVTQAGGGLLIGADGVSGNTNICVRLNAGGSRDLSFTNRFSSILSARVNSMAVQPDGKILVGGSFSTVNGTNRNNIARLNANGSLDLSFNPSSGANLSISKLLLLDNGQIIAVGSFTSYAGVSRNRIVQINADGSIVSSFNPGKGADAAITDVAQLVAGRFAIGGSFRKFGGFPRYNFAVLSSPGQVATRIGFEKFLAAPDLNFDVQCEPEVPFELLVSSNLVNWQVLYTNQLHQSFTNLIFPKSAAAAQFFRLLQLP